MTNPKKAGRINYNSLLKGSYNLLIFSVFCFLELKTKIKSVTNERGCFVYGT